MRLAEIVETSAALRATRSRTQKTERLAACVRRLGAAEVRAGVSYLFGALPQGKIGLGYATVRDAGGGAAAEASLEVAEVDRTFADIAAAAGPGSARRKLELFEQMLARATTAEREFLARLVVGELRQGASEGIMIEAIARAAGAPADAVRRAAMLAGDLAAVAEVALRDGAAALAAFRIELFRPIQPMLAQPADDVAAVLEDMDEAMFELKLDGARIQAHRDGDEVRVYTRGLNEVTAAVPEVVDIVRAMPARRLVLDGEAIALADGGAPLPFQVTMKRFGRRSDVARMRGELPLSVFLFDCLHVDGDDLLDRPTRERVAALAGVAPEAHRVPQVVTRDPDEAEAMWRRAIDAGHEGLMAKAPDAPYAAGSRGAEWRKLKPAHTLDLVVLAAEWGSGRRRGWLSNLHLGARDPAGGAFVMLGKTFKGMTDELLAWQTEALQQRAIGEDQWTVYVRPELVVEIAFNDVQDSPHYPGGVALRFARVKRYRPDKTAADADTIDAVRALRAGHRRR